MSTNWLCYRNISRFALSLIAANLLLLSSANAESEHEFAGKATLTGSYSDAIAGSNIASMSRIEGDDSFDLSGQLVVTHHYSNEDEQQQWGLFSHWQATNEGDSQDGNLGMVEFYGYYGFTLDNQQSVTMTLGQFFMSSSMENTENFWDSPYSNNFSALNTWIAQEIRPIGFELKYDWIADEDDAFSAFGIGAMSFIGNDSMGSQLAWRGWSIGRHKTVYGEILNLPEIYHIDSGVFSVQRDDGSKPFGRDLDDQYGYLLHGYWSPSDTLSINVTYMDNKGTGELYRGEYAWDTQLTIIGVKWQHQQWTVLAETMYGDSAMGNPPVMGVGVDFKTSYLLINREQQQWNYSMRIEQFDAVDYARIPKESNDGGKALTLAARWQAFGKPWSVIGELLFIDVNGQRTRALDYGSFMDEDETQLSVSLNYFF